MMVILVLKSSQFCNCNFHFHKQNPNIPYLKLYATSYTVRIKQQKMK